MSVRAVSRKCARPGCQTDIPPSQLACRNDWYALPESVRRAIVDGYDRNAVTQATEYRLGLVKAMKFWQGEEVA